MANVLVEESNIENIANAIRDKNGLQTKYKIRQMASAILDIPTSGVTIHNQDKVVTPTESTQTVTYDSGYTGLSNVTINAISSNYVGTNISRLNSINFGQASSGISVVAGPGYYSSQTTANIPLQEVTVTQKSTSQVILASDGYYGIQTITVPALETSAAFAPALTLNSSTGEITGTNTFASAFYSASTMTSQLTLSTRPGGTLIPTGAQQIAISAGYFATGSVYIDALNLISSTITPSTSSKTVTPGLGQYFNKVIVDAMPAGSAGSIITSKTISGNTAFVTAEVTNTTGYITGGTKVGAPVQVRASELVSGTKSITENGSGIDVTNYASVDVSVSGGGGGISPDQIALGTVSGVMSGSASFICSYAFYGCTSITAASFPNALSVSSAAFMGCTSLSTAYFPAATSVSASAFNNCFAMASISFPQANYIGPYAFQHCRSVQLVNMPFPVSIHSHAFQACWSLRSMNFPAAISIGSSAFYSCSSLTSAYFPAVGYVYPNAFAYCISLAMAIFPSVSVLSSSAFLACHRLLSLYLLGSSVPLVSTTTFVSTPISGYTSSTGGVLGNVFVPSSLYSSYVTATNWAPYSGQIVSFTNMLSNIYDEHYYNQIYQSVVSIGGVTFTLSSDTGVVTANGTATMSFYYNVVAEDNDSIKIANGKTYHMFGCPVGAGSSTYYLAGNLWNDDWFEEKGYADYGMGSVISCNFASADHVDMQMIIRSGAFFDNYVFKPTILEI